MSAFKFFRAAAEAAEHTSTAAKVAWVATGAALGATAAVLYARLTDPPVTVEERLDPFVAAGLGRTPKERLDAAQGMGHRAISHLATMYTRTRGVSYAAAFVAAVRALQIKYGNVFAAKVLAVVLGCTTILTADDFPTADNVCAFCLASINVEDKEGDRGYAFLLRIGDVGVELHRIIKGAA